MAARDVPVYRNVPSLVIPMHGRVVALSSRAAGKALGPAKA